MSAFASHIAYYLERYRQDDAENAFCGLTEMNHEALPELIAEFRAATDPDLRDFLLHVIWQHRQHSVIPFLGEALREGEKAVWRQAMDGLVALACPEALEELGSAKTREFPRPRDTEEFRSWLEEAMEQATQGCGS
ncbi:hypothetical protein [Prosthecobacter sp.]|jgi:hypothetical protein|uniref:hypothetical protein n=1 Tax=Prosthecobacter sp. TaxID=1965333 RepID=UPI0037C7104F